MRLRSAKVGASMSRPTKANLKANCADLQAEPQAQRFSREMRPRRRRRVARGEAEPRSGRKRSRDSATHCRRQPKTSLRPPCALSVANQLCLASKGAQRGTKVFRVGAPPTRASCRSERPDPLGPLGTTPRPREGTTTRPPKGTTGRGCGGSTGTPPEGTTGRGCGGTTE